MSGDESHAPTREIIDYCLIVTTTCAKHGASVVRHSLENTSIIQFRDSHRLFSQLGAHI